MTRTKKMMLITIVSVSALFIIGAGLAVFAGACGFDPSPRDRFHQGPFQRFHQGPFHEDIRDFMLWRLDKEIGKLNLTPPQDKAYQTLRSHVETLAAEAFKQRSEFRTQASAELNSPSPDLVKMTDQVQLHIQAMSGSIIQGIDLFENFYLSLDDNQKKIVAGHIRKRMEWHDKE